MCVLRHAVYVPAVAAVHVELEDSSDDERVVAAFLALLERSSSNNREQILADVQRAAAELRQRGVELVAVKPTGSVVAYFAVNSLSAAHELDALYKCGELRTILEEIFTCLLKSRQCQTVRIQTIRWSVNDFKDCVQYLLQNSRKQNSFCFHYCYCYCC